MSVYNRKPDTLLIWYLLTVFSQTFIKKKKYPEDKGDFSLSMIYLKSANMLLSKP